MSDEINIEKNNLSDLENVAESAAENAAENAAETVAGTAAENAAETVRHSDSAMPHPPLADIENGKAIRPCAAKTRRGLYFVPPFVYNRTVN